MSILPLGTSPSDKPARDYQARLNRLTQPAPEPFAATLPSCVLEAGENAELSASGLLARHFGPAGMCPVQLFGLLESGEFVYFRARGRKVELQISRSPEDEPHATYRKKLLVNHELGCGVLPVEVCVGYIKAWLSDYKSRSLKEFSFEEAEETLELSF